MDRVQQAHWLGSRTVDKRGEPPTLIELAEKATE
jgi:hypothetical protein